MVFAFRGQGSLYPGMGEVLFKSSSTFRESILSSQKICDSQGLPHVIKLIGDSNTDLNRKGHVQQQLALTIMEVALADL